MSQFHPEDDNPFESAANDWTLGDPPAFTWPPVDYDEAEPAAPSYQPAPAQPYAVEDNEPGVFADVDSPDGLIYTEDALSPELQWQTQQIEVPLPPVRERPQPRAAQSVEVWKPGPEPEPETPTSETVRRVIVGLIPVLVVLVLLGVIFAFAKAYGV